MARFTLPRDLYHGKGAIDALKTTVSDDYSHPDLEWADDSKLILVTAHRRENLGEPLENICNALKKLAVEFADDVQIVIDRLRMAEDDDTILRLRESVARAYSYGHDICNIIIGDNKREFSARFEADGIEFEQPTEHLFSFNNPIGACPECEGYGKTVGIDMDLVIPDKSKTTSADLSAEVVYEKS